MARRVLVIVGHPDPDPARFCRALAGAYAQGAEASGHSVRTIDIATLAFPLLRTQDEFQHGSIPGSLQSAAEAIGWAEHYVFVFPLWLGTMPALLKAFLEQTMRPGTAFVDATESGGFGKPLLKGRSARIVVTMGMPALLYRLWYLNHGIAGMRRCILHLVGISPVRETLLGRVESRPARRSRWLERMRRLGERAG